MLKISGAYDAIKILNKHKNRLYNMNIYDNKRNELIGKILFLLSIIISAVMICIIFKMPFLEHDEWFTKGIIQLSFKQMVSITAIDVHPPLFYIILKIPMKILAMLNISYDLVTLMKFMSVLPLFILFVIGATKIRRDYGWLTAGFFTFTLVSMASFFRVFLIARMYSWAILFLVLCFLCVCNILKESDYKSWILLTVFSVLGAYTHYFTAISIVLIYLILFVNILFNKNLGFDKKEDLKKWFVCVVLGIIMYVPWLVSLFGQLKSVHKSHWLPSVDINLVITSLSSVFTNNLELFLLNVVCAIVILAVTVLFLSKYLKSPSKKNFYLLMGMSVFITTLALAIVISLVFKPIILERYFVPSIALVWLSISILMSEIDFKKLALPIIIVVLLFGAYNIMDEISVIDENYNKTLETYEFLDSIDNNNSIVIIDGMQKYMRFDNEINNATKFYAYQMNNETHKSPYIKLLKIKDKKFNIPDDINSSGGKDIYLLVDGSRKLNNTDVEFDRLFNIHSSTFYKIKTKSV